MATTDLKSFNYLENGEIAFSMYDTIRSTKKLESGSYNLTIKTEYPKDITILSLNNDEETSKIHLFPDKKRVDELFNSFFNEEVVIKIKKLGFYHKVGVMLYGKEGTGKSTIVKNYCFFAIEQKQAIVFYISCDPEKFKVAWSFIQDIRKIQDNPIIVVLEEFDSFVEDRNSGFMKTVLDGNNSINHCIFFATTNYIEKIPDAIKNRPSRFKYMLNIEGIQNKDEIYGIIKRMLEDLFLEKQLREFASELQGSTLDTIKQYCIDKIMDIDSYNQDVKKVGFKR